MPYKYDFFYSIIISSLSRDMTHVRISEFVRTSRVTGNLAGDRNLHKEREVQQNDEA